MCPLLCPPDYRSEMDLHEFIVAFDIRKGPVTLTRQCFLDQ